MSTACFCAPPPGSTSACSISASLTWSPMVCSGESEVIGSWKIIAMRPPRMRPHGSRSRARARRCRAAVRRSPDRRTAIDAAADRAPSSAGSAGSPERSPTCRSRIRRRGRRSCLCGISNDSPSTARKFPDIGCEIDREMADGQERLIHRLLQQTAHYRTITRYGSTTFPVLSQNNF